MNNPTFQILGTETAPMLGRDDILQQITRNFSKKTPSNLQLVGPRYIGKSVIMNELANKFANNSSGFQIILTWHLGHLTPQSDQEFISQLCDNLCECLSKSSEDTSEYEKYLKEHTYSNFTEVTEILDGDGQAILMLWDGFDKPLGQGKLTGNLWDQMRHVFYGRKHKIITATRKPLSQLIRNEDAINSPFWNIFDSPIRIMPFCEQDQGAIISKLTNHTIESGAETELRNWSAGLPIIFLDILNQIIGDMPSGAINNKIVNEAAEKSMERLNEHLSFVWQDCSIDVKDLYFYLLEHGEQNIENVGKAECNSLISTGLANKSSNKISTSCRMFDSYVTDQKTDSGNIERIFGSWDAYRKNIRSFLERRFSQIPKFDDRFHRRIERAIEDIPDYPDDCLEGLNDIRDHALKLIWQKEFGDIGDISEEIIKYWTMEPRCGQNQVKKMMNNDNWKIPSDPLRQIIILQLLTGSYPNFESKSKTTSKDTYVLINTIHSFRNRTIHPEGQEIHLGVAVSAIMACIELLACLEREQIN